jgi:hypothetical protein
LEEYGKVLMNLLSLNGVERIEMLIPGESSVNLDSSGMNVAVSNR